MMKKLSVFLSFSLWASAAVPVVQRVVVDFVDYSTARVNVRISPVVGDPQIQVRWGYSPTVVTTDTFQMACINTYIDETPGPDVSDCSMQVLRTLPNSKIYVHVRVKDGAEENTTWGCSGASINQGTLTGLTCTAGEPYPWYMSAPNPGPANVAYPAGTLPEKAAPPTYTLPTFGTLTEGDNLFTVAPDCSDIVAKIASAAGNAASKDVLVRTPYGPTHVCPALGALPLKSAAHKVVVRSSAPDACLPPPGGRLQPAYEPCLTIINSDDAAVYLQNGVNGYYFVGIEFTNSSEIPAGNVPALQISSTSQQYGTTTWRIDVTGGTIPSTVTTGSMVILEGVSDLGSSTGACKPGPVKVNAVLSPTALMIYCDEGVVPALPDTTPNRWMVTHGTQRIAAVTPGACAGGNARITLGGTARVGLPNDYVIHTANAVGLTGFNDQNWRVISTSGNQTCLQNSTGVTGTHTANTGIYALEASPRQIIGSLSVGATDIWFDRCWAKGLPFPNKVGYAVNFTGTSNSGFVNGIVDNVGGWLAIDPATGVWASYIVGLGLGTGIAFEMTYTQHMRIENNTITGNGIFIFPQQHNATVSSALASDILVRRNRIVALEERRSGSPVSKKLYYPHRHAIECKTCLRMEVDGNEFDGNWSDDVTSGVTIAFTPRQMSIELQLDPTVSPGGVRDVMVSNNIFHHVAGGSNIQLLSDSNKAATFPTVRMGLINNEYQIDWFTYRSNPSSCCGAAYPTGMPTAGTPWFLSLAHSLAINHNTVFDSRGEGPRTFSLGGFTVPIPHWTMTNNILSDNRTVDAPVDISGLYSLFDTSFGKTWGATLASYYAQSDTNGAFSPDPYSLWRGNIVVPGTENAQSYTAWDSSCYTRTEAGCNIEQAQSQAYWGTAQIATYWPDTTGATFTGTTPSARFAQMKWQNSAPTGWPAQSGSANLRLKSDSPGVSGARATTDGRDAGVDYDAATAAQGRLSSGATLTPGTSKTIVYIAPEVSTQCYVKTTATLTDTTSAWTPDTTGSRERNTVVTGASPKAWLDCGVQLYQCPMAGGPCVLQQYP